MIPPKLKRGDEIRVVAPGLSLSIISKEQREIAEKNFSELGLKLSFGKHAEEIDSFSSSSIESRISDIEDAFLDTNVKGVLSVIGGSNSNQLLDHLDWKIIKNNPKVLCGFSDITILNNAILAKTDLITYSGPHYSSLTQRKYLGYTIDYFKKCLMDKNPYFVYPSDQWSDDKWYIDQENRNLVSNNGYLNIYSGDAEGKIIGGNLCTFNLLQGTEYFPGLENTILFLEDDEGSKPQAFDRDLTSLSQQKGFDKVKGIVIGRFQNGSNMTNNILKVIISTNKRIKNIPVIANVDFGHTDPRITFPIGGIAKLSAKNSNCNIEILSH